MSHLLFWPTIVYFYPIGNTSAVCLTENLPPESKADILLLGCGDPRHILYTIYANETNPLMRTRMFDITCCDVDVAILARNTLLFTILAEDGALNKLDNLWNLFYHMFVDRASLSVLFEQCRKLVALAESVETWRVGPYGHFLTTCDTRTLVGLRRMWTTYLSVATFSPKQAKQFERRFLTGMKEMSQKKRGGSTTTASRSAGPLALYVDQATSSQFSSYWSSGITNEDMQGQGQKQHMSVNPTFAFSNHGDEFALHYAADPLCGFHLAEAFASGKFTRLHESIPPHEVVRVAKEQFTRWCTSINKCLKDSNPSSPTFVIRMFAGDALTFCQALKYCDVMRSSVTPCHVTAWQFSTITLDDHYYGRNAVSPAPLSFNVIDTSNIMDHVGLINVLVATAPLLRKIPSATLYTEALLRKSDNPSQAILEHVCGDLSTMALLLGIIPSTLISQFTTRFNTYENLTMGGGASQYHERLAWKAIGSGGPETQRIPDSLDVSIPSQLSFPPEGLARFLFHVYIRMFSDEDIESGFQPLPFFPFMFPAPRPSGILHYNRRSFALLVHFVKTRIQTDWWRAMNLFEGLVMSDRRLVTGEHAYQELCCQLHILGVYTANWMSVPALRLHCLEFQASVGLFRDWDRSCIPQVVTLVLVVPRDAITVLEPDFTDIGTPVLQCDIQDGPRESWFAVISATFGSLRVSGTSENRTGVIVEGDSDTNEPPWRTEAPLNIIFSVPSGLVMDFSRNPRATVGLVFRATPRVITKFANRLGPDLTVFRTNFMNARRVFVLAQPPVVGTAASTITSGDTSVVMTSHWQENSAQADRSANPTFEETTDIRVRMDMSSAVQSFAVRIDITDPSTQAVLANTQTVPTVMSSSGSTRSLDVCVRVGTYTYSLRFPLPVDIARTELHVVRQPSYIEVVAPLAPFEVRPESDLSNRFTPLSLDPSDYTPALGSIHRLNLDRCPTFKLFKEPSELDWCDMHTRLMFSELEEQRALLSQMKPPGIGPTHTTDTLLHVKQTLHLLLRSAAGAMPDGKAPGRVFALCDTSRREVAIQYLYVVVAYMRLDVGSHTVAADAFVAPGSPAVRAALNMALHHSQGSQRLDDTKVRCIATDADETMAWFHLLPRLTERCRTWSHKTNCIYRTSKHREQRPNGQGLGVWRGQSPLCNCGTGVGTEILPKAFKQLGPYLTRAALSPLFTVPYLEEAQEGDVPVGSPTMDTDMRLPWMTTTSRAPSHDQNANVGNTDAVEGNRCRSCGEEGRLRCSRCKQTRYCSKACQRADWKTHKKVCESVTRAACVSGLATIGAETSSVTSTHPDLQDDERNCASEGGPSALSSLTNLSAPADVLASTRRPDQKEFHIIGPVDGSDLVDPSARTSTVASTHRDREDGKKDYESSIAPGSWPDLATSSTGASTPVPASSSSESQIEIDTIVGGTILVVALVLAGALGSESLRFLGYIGRSDQ